MSLKTQLSGKRRVFNLLRTEGVISRAALSQRCGLTRPAVSAIVEELVREGLVEEVGRGDSTGGSLPFCCVWLPEAVVPSASTWEMTI